MFKNTTFQDAIRSRTWWYGTITGLLEFAKMAFPNNAKVILAIQVVTGLMTLFGLRDAAVAPKA